MKHEKSKKVKKRSHLIKKPKQTKDNVSVRPTAK